MFFNKTALFNYTVLSLQTKFFKQQTGNLFIAKVKKVPFSKKRGGTSKIFHKMREGKGGSEKHSPSLVKVPMLWTHRLDEVITFIRKWFP